MSLRHANNSNGEKHSFPDLPELEPLPELDDLFDEFDSGGLLSEDKNSSFEPSKIDELPRESELPEDDVFREESTDIASSNGSVNEEEIEISDEEINSKFTSLPDIDLSDDDTELSDEDEGIIEEDADELPNYDEDLDVPDMEFEDFKVIDESEVDDPEYDKTNDDEVLNPEEEDPYGYDLDGDNEFKGSLLPGVDMGEEFEPVIEPEPDNEPVEEKAPKNNSNKKDGFKELDEERVKEFFTGLIAKFKGKGNKDKESRIKNEPVNKDNKAPLSKVKLNKSKLIYAGIALAVVILLLVSYMMWGNSYKSIDDFESTVKISGQDEDTNIELNKFLFNEDGNLEVNLKNDGSISKDLVMYLTLKGKSAIPFTGDKIGCESDIIAMEPGGEVKEILTCSGDLDKNLEYKLLNVEVDEL